jgi:hypothetical protein
MKLVLTACLLLVSLGVLADPPDRDSESRGERVDRCIAEHTERISNAADRHDGSDRADRNFERDRDASLHEFFNCTDANGGNGN